MAMLVNSIGTRVSILQILLLFFKSVQGCAPICSASRFLWWSFPQSLDLHPEGEDDGGDLDDVGNALPSAAFSVNVPIRNIVGCNTASTIINIRALWNISRQNALPDTCVHSDTSSFSPICSCASEFLSQSDAEKSRSVNTCACSKSHITTDILASTCIVMVSDSEREWDGAVPSKKKNSETPFSKCRDHKNILLHTHVSHDQFFESRSSTFSDEVPRSSQMMLHWETIHSQMTQPEEARRNI